MKVMRIKKTTAALFLMLLFTASVTVSGAFAATKSIDVVTDDFDADVLHAQWDISDQEKVYLDSPRGAIQIVRGEFATSVGWRGLRTGKLDATGNGKGLSNDYILEYTFSKVGSLGDWVSLYIGNEKAAQRFNQLTAAKGTQGSVLVVSSTNVSHYIGQGLYANGSAALSTYSLPAAKHIAPDGTRYCVKVVTHFGNDVSDRSQNTADFYLTEEPADRNGFDNIDYGNPVVTLDNINLAGYFGFGSLNTGKAAVSDIRVTDPDGKLLYAPKDDLKTPTVEHAVGSGSAEYYDYEFRVWNSTSGQYNDSYYNGPYGNAVIEGENSLFTDSDITLSDDMFTLFDLKFTLDASGLGAGGMDVTLGGKLLVNVKCNSDGRFVYTNGNTAVTTETAAKKTSVSISAKADGAVLLSANGVSAEFRVDGITGGKLAFAGKDADGKIILDDIALIGYEYLFSQSASEHINFSLKDSGGAPYLDPNVWYLGGNAMAIRGLDEIAFINAKNTAMIATRRVYTDYVVKFDLVDITKNDSNTMVSINFGKENYNDILKDCNSFIFVPRAFTDGVSGYMNIEALNGLTFTSGTNVKQTANWFDDEYGAVNVMLVMRNDGVSVHYKYDFEPESALAVPRAVMTGVNTVGYFGISANNSANFSVKNLSVTNLSPDRHQLGSGVGDSLTAGDESILG